jgi:hypothetical protein
MTSKEHTMSETPTDSTGTGQDDDLNADADSSADLGAGPESDLAKGDDVSTGTDGVGGGNESRSSVLEDTLGAGGDLDEGDRDQ